MKIESHNPLLRTGQTTSRDDVQKAKGADQTTTKGADSASTTQLSHQVMDSSQDINTARVAEIREAIQDGRLEIRADKIADSLIASVQELLDNK